MHHVMAVDDSHVIRRLVEVSLEQLHLTVHTAADGTEACSALLQSPPDLLILDVGLPDMSGFDVLRFARAEPALDGLPVIMLTGYADSDDYQQADEAGVSAYLVKPFRPADLRRAVVDALHEPERTTA